MGIFKKKSKAEKGQKDDGKKQEAVPSTPAPQPYKPKHAAADAVPKPAASGINGRRLSKEASDYASGSATFQHPLANNVNHPFAQAQNNNNFRSPSTPLAPYRGFNGGFSGMQRNQSAEVFTTDPDAPPMPTSTSTYSTPGQRDGLPRSGSGYFNERDTHRTYDSSAVANPNPKMAAATKDRSYIDPHRSADSGYGSEGHSRAPSEQGYGHETPKPQLLQDTGSFLPELSLSDELAKEPAWSEASFGGDSPVITPRAVDDRHHGQGYFSHLDPVNTSRSTASKPSRHTSKQTRSESAQSKPIKIQQQTEPKPSRKESRSSPQSNYLPEPVQDDVRPESSTLPQSGYGQQGRNEQYEEPRPSYAAPIRHSTPPPQRLPEPQPQYTVPARMSTPPPARDREPSLQQQPMQPARTFSPPPMQQAQGFAPLERFVSQRSSVPAHGTLEGYKVNKRGKILDEEGEVIGELVEGDIIDCVRQRCNAYGEVLDDRGRVVGRVQAVDNATDSPIMRIASPAPMHYHQQHFTAHQSPPQTHQTPLSPTSQASQRPNRRESGASQQDVFTPAWQRQSHSTQSGLAQELRDHLNAQPQSANRAVAPVEYPGNVSAIELDGSGRRSEEEEVLPLFDHSEVFMPVPFVPPRSPKRSETPSPPAQKGRRTSHQPQSATQSQLLSPTQAQQPSPAMQQKQSKHTSAPPASRYQSPAVAQAQPSQKSWAASELIEQTEEPEEPKAQTTVSSPTASAPAQAPSRSHAPVAQELSPAPARSYTTATQEPTPSPNQTSASRVPAAGTVADTAFALRAAAAAATSPTSSEPQIATLTQATESAFAARAAAAAPKSSTFGQASAPQASESAFALRAAAAAGSPLPRLETQQRHVLEQEEPVQQTQQALPAQQPQQQPRRGILRSSSETSMNDLSKSYSRPSMSPVPEDGSVAEDAKDPAMFAYKGDIPAQDGPVSNAKNAPSRLNGAKSPPLPSFPRQAFTGGLPAGAPFAPMNSAQFSSAGGLSTRATPPRTFSTGVPGPRPIPQFQSKNSFTNAPLKRSPLSSQQTTPPESDEGSNDGEKSMNNIGLAQGMHSRQPSLRSMRSMASTASKPRTYFTHGGRVTVEAGVPPPSQQPGAQKQETEPAPSIKSEGAKKSRFSIGFGKKKN